MAIDFNDKMMEAAEGPAVILASGIPGQTPNFSIGEVDSVAPDAGAEVELTGTVANPILNFKLPRGVSGSESINDNAGPGDTDFVWSANKTYDEIEAVKAEVKSDIINDNAGEGDTDYVWSADKSYQTLRKVDTVYDTIDSIIPFAKRELQAVTLTIGHFWNCEGETAVYADNENYYASGEIAVAPGEIYTVYGRIGSTHKARVWLVTDNDLKIIDSSGDTYGASNQSYTIVVPDGGTKLLLTNANSNIYMRKLDWSETINTSNCLKYRASLSALSITSLSDCTQPGWYGCGAAYAENITDLPDGFRANTAINLFVFNYTFNSGDDVSNPQDSIHYQVLIGTDASIFQRLIYLNSGTVDAWHPINRYVDLVGKTVAVIGDSISTNGNDGTDRNVPEITIADEDVGVELNAWLTYYDVQAGLTLGGHTFTDAEIGTKVTFTPNASDVGKVIGLPNNYNPNSRTVWWEVAQKELGFTTIPVCWSGSSITSHEGGINTYKTSYAWHEAQIRKCGIRTPGTITRTAPDVIIIYRGTNDFSHEPYTKLTEGYFDAYDWDYPESDSVTGGYGFKEGLCLTIKKLRETYPSAKIFLCTLNVFKRVNYSHFPTNNGVNSLPQYNDAIREVADFMGIGLIEFDKDGITFENCYSEGYITDSATIPTHPSDKGHKVMGMKAIADLKAKYSPMK